MMKPLSNRSRGFTLLEVIVAVAVFAVLSTLAYSGLTRMLEGRNRLEAERERWRVVALAFAQMEDDLSQVRSRGIRNVDGSLLPALRGQPVDTRALSDPSLEFTRGGLYVTASAATHDLQRVAYRFKDGALWRQVWPVLDRPPGIEPRSTILLPNIDNVAMRFHAPGTGWADHWPAEDAKQPLPDAVEFAFDLAGVGRFTRILMVAQ